VEDFTLSYAMPNPFTSSTSVQINTIIKEDLTLSLSDISGKELYKCHSTLEVGLHHFIISTSGNQYMFLNVSNGKLTKTIKLINLGNQISGNQITYTGVIPQRQIPPYKNLKSSGFVYYLGDQLLYTASAARYYNDTIIDSPFQDTTYTFELTHLPWQCGDPVYYEGLTYNTVQISTQCWMKENLNIGTMIDSYQEQTDNDTIEKYCYNNNEWNCAIYGGLYQWDEVMQYTTTPGSMGLCPPGWHLPTDPEWTILVYYLGGPEIAGGKMKEAGYAHWLPPNTGATNESGFTGLPGGRRVEGGLTNFIGTHAYIWSSTQISSTQALERRLFSAFTSCGPDELDKIWGCSVRCVKTTLR
jgi:uncharacterized protein (TIGR02145 family)